MPNAEYGNIIRVSKREEREHILGTIEFIRDEMGDTSYEKYAKKKLNTIIHILETE